MSYSVVKKTSNSSSLISDGYYCYILDATSNNIVISLDDISSYDGVPFLFIRVDTNSSNTVSLSAYSTQLIDGYATKSLLVGESYELISFEQNWVSH